MDKLYFGLKHTCPDAGSTLPNYSVYELSDSFDWIEWITAGLGGDFFPNLLVGPYALVLFVRIFRKYLNTMPELLVSLL